MKWTVESLQPYRGKYIKIHSRQYKWDCYVQVRHVKTNAMYGMHIEGEWLCILEDGEIKRHKRGGGVYPLDSGDTILGIITKSQWETLWHLYQEVD